MYNCVIINTKKATLNYHKECILFVVHNRFQTVHSGTEIICDSGNIFALRKGKKPISYF